MTDYRSLYDKDYIGAWDIIEGDLTVTIKKCIGGSLIGPGGRKSKKPVVYMAHTEKGFALNVTNGKTIAALYGTHVEKWAGKKITLYKSMTRSPDGSGDVECIRVRPSIPESAAPENSPLSARNPTSGEAPAATDTDVIDPEQIMEIESLLEMKGLKERFNLKMASLKITSVDKIQKADYESLIRWIDKQK